MSNKRLLTPDQFSINEKGEVVIKDANIASKIEEAKANKESNIGEQGWSVGLVVSPT